MNPWVIRARTMARKAGLIGVINRFRAAGPYEQRVNEALSQAVHPGDVVWDIGANVGVYSEIFCRQVGSSGTVVAFEPFADSCAQIRQRLADCSWLRVENIALGEVDTQGRLVMGPASVENHLETEADKQQGDSDSVPVEICRADTMLNRLGRTPNVVKVDVEGFEEEVLNGMHQTLQQPDLRAVLVEVHFMKLEQRGREKAPIRIEKLLAGKGFRTQWVDASHIFATR